MAEIPPIPRVRLRESWPTDVRLAALEHDADRIDLVRAQDLAELRSEIAAFRTTINDHVAEVKDTVRGVGRIAIAALIAMLGSGITVGGSMLLYIARTS